MKKIFVFLLLFSFIFASGAFFGARYYKVVRLKKKGTVLDAAMLKPKEFPITENKEFVILISSYNNQRWVERNLRSVLEQDYDHYRIVYIDDCSNDGTAAKVQAFVENTKLKSKLTLIQNVVRKGPVLNQYLAIHDCQDGEIVVNLDGDDWFAHEGVLSKLNRIYQNPDVWLTYGQYVDYPGFTVGVCQPFEERKLQKNGYRGHPWVSSHLRTFYAGLFKKIKISDFFFHGKILDMCVDYAMMIPMIEMTGGKYAFIPDVMYMYNRSNVLAEGNVSFLLQKASASYIRSFTPYEPLKELFSAPKEHAVDLVVFSYNRPMQLYAFLESLQKYVSGFYRISVIYRASDEAFESGYEKVKDDFIGINFLRQENQESFKPLLLQSVFEERDPPSDYVLFAVDDIIVKDYLNLQECVLALEDTHAYGFYLRLGNHTDHSYALNFQQGIPQHVALKNHINAWHFEFGKGDFGYPHSVDMTLYRKEDIKKDLYEMKYHNPNTLEGAWSNIMPKNLIALYYDTSKVINIPVNQVHISQNRSMKSFTPLDLLHKFDEGQKINIDPYFQLQNPSAQCEYPIEFIQR